VQEFGSLERLVMEQLWNAPEPLLIRETVELINATAERPLAYTTVQTVCDRLVRKGLLERLPAGRANRYRPLLTREEYTAELMLEVIDASADRGSVFQQFVDRVEGPDLRRLRAALEHRRPRRRS
jgi:BlaI family transcriptional regulator, penicillinase repressor